MESKEMELTDLFDELKKELFFLPDIDEVRQGFVDGFVMSLLG